MNSTYQRFKEALEQIAQGCPKPAAVASKALQSRVELPNPNSKRQRKQRELAKARTLREAAREYRKKTAIEMWVAGKSNTEIANSIGANPTTIAGDIKQYIGTCPKHCFYHCQHQDCCSLRSASQCDSL